MEAHLNKILSLLLLFIIFVAFPANGQSGQYPKELEKVAFSYGMTPLYDFSKIDPKNTNLTYVYGFAEGNKSDSAVLWAWKVVSGKTKYYLVFMDKTTHRDDYPMTIK